jgi:ribonuclease HI
VECNGCSFNIDSTEISKYTSRSIKCGSIVDIDLPQIINVTFFSSVNSEKLYLLKKNIKAISDQTIQHYMRMSSNSLQLTCPSYFTIESFINSPATVSLLNSFKNRLKHEKSLLFYTDGSHRFLPDHTDPITYISSALLLVHDNLDIEFSTALPRFWSNSTNAEIFALLLVLIICPHNLDLTVCTDSLALIYSYNKIQRQNAFLYPSLMFKLPFNIYWSIIFKIIEERNISLTLTKVKAHSNDPYNDKVDQLAKSSLHSSSISITFNHIPYFSYIPLFEQMPIFTAFRPLIKDFLQTKHFMAYYLLKRNKKYTNLEINYKLTFQLLKLGSPSTTSFEESRAHCRRIKFLLEQLPTIEFLKAIPIKNLI